MDVIPTHPINPGVCESVHFISLNPEHHGQRVRYWHRDDYFLLGVVQQGEVVLNVDFKVLHLGAGSLYCMFPHQVHRIESLSLDCHGVSAAFIPDIIGKQELTELNKQRFNYRAAVLDSVQARQLNSLFETARDVASNTVKEHILRAIVSFAIDCLAHKQSLGSANVRHQAVALRFLELLDHNLAKERQPAFYADKLCITVGYLNEIVKSCLGCSTGSYIAQETLLRAKRELVYTDKTIQDISWDLGFEDYAYFSRFFSKHAGMSPAAFRDKYLDLSNNGR